MSAEHTPDHSIVISTYASGRIEVDTSLEQFQVMHNVARKNEGMTLEEMARRDPTRAYTCIKALLRAVAHNLAYTTISVNGSVIAENDHDSPEELQTMAQTLVRNLPDEFGPAFDFSLGLFPSPDDIEIFGSEAATRTPLVDIHVEPPSLAA
jgi:hypothetical protein